MIEHRLNTAAATEAARKLMEIVNRGEQWSMANVESCLPEGWELGDLAEHSDFFPCTVANFTQIYRACAIKKETK